MFEGSVEGYGGVGTFGGCMMGGWGIGVLLLIL